MPQRYREALAALAEESEAKLVLTLHPHRHLTLYGEARFDEMREAVMKLPNLGYEASHFQETLVGCAEEVALDSAGRMVVSSALRGRAGIERDVLLFGVGDKIHIWDEKAWERRDTMVRARLQDRELAEPWQELRI